MSDQNEMLAHKIDEVFHKAAQRYLTLLPGEEKEKGQRNLPFSSVYPQWEKSTAWASDITPGES